MVLEAFVAGSGSLHNRVVEDLGLHIVNGTIPGGTLLSADILSERYGVSRSVIRESLRVLESMGMIRARPQVGTRVLPSANWNLFHPQIVEWRGRGQDYLRQMEEVLEMRLGIEQVAARLSCERMLPEQIDALVGAVDAMALAAERSDRASYVDADALFHLLLLQGSNNAMIAQFASTVSAVLHTRELGGRLPLNERTPPALAIHREVAVAVASRDADKAEATVRQLIESTVREFHEMRKNDEERGTQ